MKLRSHRKLRQFSTLEPPRYQKQVVLATTMKKASGNLDKKGIGSSSAMANVDESFGKSKSLGHVAHPSHERVGEDEITQSENKARVKWANEVVVYEYEPEKRSKFALLKKVKGMKLDAIVGPCKHPLIGKRKMFWMAKFQGWSGLAFVGSKEFKKRFPAQVLEFYERRLEITDNLHLESRVLVDEKNNAAMALVDSGLRWTC